MYICGDGGTAYLGNSNCNNNVSVVLGDDCLGPTNYAIGITIITISITITLHYITIIHALLLLLSSLLLFLAKIDVEGFEIRALNGIKRYQHHYHHHRRHHYHHHYYHHQKSHC
jgi:hypothetical protein